MADEAERLIEALVRIVRGVGSYTDPGVPRHMARDIVREFELDGASIWRARSGRLLVECAEGEPIDESFARSAMQAPQVAEGSAAWPLEISGRTLGVFAISGSISKEKRLLAGMLAGRCAHMLSDARQAATQQALLEGLSHELRAPLQSLLGHVDLLQAGTFGDLSPDQVEAVRIVASAAEKILAVAGDVLAVARIDSGHDRVEAGEVALSELLVREVEQVRPLAERKGLSVELTCPPGLIVNSDEAKLARILTNLLDNAVKYTDSGSVRVRAGPGWIEVCDTGVGIPAARHRDVFDEYVRLDATREGTGLGLSIVRRLAGLLGTRLSLDSAPGHGTTVRIELP